MKMNLTAERARQITDASEKVFTQLIADVEREISDAASKGDDTVRLANEKLTTTVSHMLCEMTQIQKRVHDVLRLNGYIVRWTQGAPYVPKGLAADDGSGPSYSLWYLQVSWPK